MLRNIQNNLSYIILFCYIFAFFIGNISISLLIAIPLYIFALLNKEYLKSLLLVLHNKYSAQVFSGWLCIVSIGIIFPIIFYTFDYSFLQIVLTQFFHLVAAFPVIAFFRYSGWDNDKALDAFVVVFVVQTIIQCIVVSSESLSDTILYFNHYEPDRVIGLGSRIRGKALSAATTYHLSLAYGIAFIIYVKQYLSRKITLKHIVIGILIFVGIFFAGRTGFVGVLLGCIAFLFANSVHIGQKLKSVCYTIIISITCIVLLKIALPDFYDLLETHVFPYAFEFLYSIGDSGHMETASTNDLLSMWKNDDIQISEIIFGSGRYTGDDGKYYMHVDPGILRHTLYMGVFGYLCLAIYQLILLPIQKMNKQTRFYYGIILLYLFIMDFKAVTIGINKFTFSICLFLSYSQFYLSDSHLNKDSDIETNYKFAQ